eukprot:5487926-Pleurochrysis_carterae.AAC.4
MHPTDNDVEAAVSYTGNGRSVHQVGPIAQIVQLTEMIHGPPQVKDVIHDWRALGCEYLNDDGVKEALLVRLAQDVLLDLRTGRIFVSAISVFVRYAERIRPSEANGGVRSSGAARIGAMAWAANLPDKFNSQCRGRAPSRGNANGQRQRLRHMRTGTSGTSTCAQAPTWTHAQT